MMDTFDRAFEAMLAYDLFIYQQPVVNSFENLVAAALAGQVADAEFSNASQATSSTECRRFLEAAEKARRMQRRHQLIADIVAVAEGWS